MSEHSGTDARKRSVYVDPATNYLFTTDPQTGALVPIIDPETGSPLSRRPLFIDPDTQRYCTIDPASGKATWIPDPITGKPLTSQLPASEEQSAPTITPDSHELSAGFHEPSGDHALSNVQEELEEPSPQLNGHVSARASGSAIAAFVLGILAIATCFIPVVNYVSFAIALLGLVFALVGLAGIRKNKTRGRGIARAGALLSAFALAIVVASQFFYGQLVDDFMSGTPFGPACLSQPGADDGESKSSTLVHDTIKRPSQP